MEDYAQFTRGKGQKSGDANDSASERERGGEESGSFILVCLSDWHGARKNDATVLSMNALPLAGSAGSPLSSPDVASCAV